MFCRQTSLLCAELATHFLRYKEFSEDSEEITLCQELSDIWRTWNFRVPLARLARHAVNLCGACAGCVTACTPGASAPLPEKAQSSEPKEITDLWHGEELLNDVIGRLWPSISEWFQRKLKAELEPQLKEQLMDIVEFEDIGLGTSPMRLEGITSSTSSEE
eukprot:s1456_g3.t2